MDIFVLLPKNPTRKNKKTKNKKKWAKLKFSWGKTKKKKKKKKYEWKDICANKRANLEVGFVNKVNLLKYNVIMK